jgi:hypothetical protein
MDGSGGHRGSALCVTALRKQSGNNLKGRMGRGIAALEDKE